MTMRALARQWLRPRASVITLVFGFFIVLLITLQPPSAPGACVVGDVRALRAGRVPETLRHTLLDARRMQAGVGVGAVEGWEGLGDAIATSGRVFVRTTRTDSVRIQSLESGRFFQTSYWVYVPTGSPTRETLSVQAATSLDNLWRQLARRHPEGVLVAGYVHWQTLRRYAITRPAIDGLAIPENATHYYTQAMQNLPDTWAYVVGIAASAQAIARNDKSHEPLFARRPDGGLDLPVHVLVLKQAPTDLTRAPKPEEALLVGRAAGDSLLVSAELSLYALGHPGSCQDAFVASGTAPAEPSQ